jgi:O-antigen/teichoic acid export membrane protein
VKRKNLLQSSAIYAAGMILPKLMSIILLPIFTRILDPSDYGILAYTTSIVEFLFIFSVLALNSYVLRFWMDIDPDDEQARRRLVGAVFTFLCAFNLVIQAVCFLVGPLAIQGFGVDVPFYPYFALSLIASYFSTMSVIPLVVYRLLDRPGAYVGLMLSRSLVYYGLAYVMIVHFDQGLLGMYLAQVITYGVFSFFYFGVIWRHGTFTWDLDIIRKGLVFSLPLIPGVLAHLMIRLVDRVMLEAHVSLDRLGIYSIGYTLGFFSLTALVQGGYQAFEPAVFQAWGRDDFAERWRRIRTTFIALVVVATVGVGLLGQELLEVLTAPKFHDAYRVVPLVALAACLRGIGLLYTLLLVAAKKTRESTVVVMVGAGVNVGVNLVLIPPLGIMGAAWSSVAAFAAMIVVGFLICDRSRLDRSRGPLALDMLAVAMGAALVVWVVYGIAPAVSWTWVGIKLLLILGYAALIAVMYRLWRLVR